MMQLTGEPAASAAKAIVAVSHWPDGQMATSEKGEDRFQYRCLPAAILPGDHGDVEDAAVRTGEVKIELIDATEVPDLDLPKAEAVWGCGGRRHGHHSTTGTGSA